MNTKAKSPRVKSTGLTNRLDFETTIDRIAYAQLELRQLQAERDAAVHAAQATHADLIAELETEIKAKAALCEKFADEHRADLLPGKAKSNETPLSRYGFRLGNRTVKTLSKWTWTKVLDALKEMGVKSCIRTVEEVDKEEILKGGNELTGDLTYRDGEGDTVLINLADLGVKIVQAESFFIEPKVDGAEPVKAEA
jgi:phage host-nuclease inhibitor protein Gam